MNQLNRQLIFDTVATHLLKQRQQSYRTPMDAKIMGLTDKQSGCQYRGPNGLKCAIGALIPDDRYDNWCEGLTISAPDMLKYIDPKYFVTGKAPDALDTEEGNFMFQLQAIHDRSETMFWRESLMDFARRNDLDSSVLGAL